MYFIIYSFCYVFSLLPWRIMYLLSDLVAFILQRVVKYRVNVVQQNLAMAFPHKSIEERKKIMKDFYQQFTDSFIETFKLLSMSDKTFNKRFTSNADVLTDLYKTGQNVQIMAGHFFNWEFANWGAAKYGQYPFIGVYMPLSNPHFNKIILGVRKRYGSIMIPATNFRAQFQKFATEGRYAMALAADQNPGNPLSAFWIPFFGHLTPFVKGPEKGAKLNNTAQVFVHFYRTKRGYYHSQYEIMTTSPNYFKDGQLTALYVKVLEEKIKQNPANYLWTHRRWRYPYDATKHSNLVVH
ncbi:MAG: lipid A biosynthesis acyltransferase [Chitinophagia bacterium]|jgi:Kdo2-lipid IVA lauroyltransferase/acyltransferase